ncbi:uncharacterized protein LOC116949747 [Petromyzon marinus]|uniref:Transmembrane protein 100 n=1 Tax=Petromyzon marinus TaxID=7757 RepID=A0AAJ7TSE6_PETMA|nr:transmembrane protein 100 [Petromyzon marinus]
MSDGYIQKGPLHQSGRSEPPRPHSGTEPNNPKATASSPPAPPPPSSAAATAAGGATGCGGSGARLAPGRYPLSPQRQQQQQQLQLLAATGGAEGACYKCLAPFGVALLVSGAAVSAVAYGRNAHGSPITLLGLALLGLGALLGLLGAAGCLLHRHRELSRARRESRTTLVVASVP